MLNDPEALWRLVGGTRIHMGVPLAVIIAVIAFILLERTVLGFEIKVAGLAPAAARHAGFSARRLVWLSFMISGGLSGMAGMLEVAGPVCQLVPVITPGYGFTASFFSLSCPRPRHRRRCVWGRGWRLIVILG